MKNSIAWGLLGVVITTFAALPARADRQSAECREALVVTPPIVANPVVDQAIADLETAIRQLPAPTSDWLPDRIIAWFRTRPFRQAVRALRKLNLSTEDQQAACAKFIALSGEQHLVNRQPKVIAPLIERLCPSDVHAALLSVTRSAMDTPAMSYSARYLNAGPVRNDEAENARKWLVNVIRSGTLSTPDWMDLIDSRNPERIIPIADAVDGHWEKLGMDLSQVREIAGRILQSGPSLSGLAHWMTIPGTELDALVPSMNPVQWLEFMHMRGHLQVDLTAQLKSRISAATALNTKRYLSQAVDSLADIVLDVSVPFEVVDKTFAQLEKAWPKLYGKGAKLSISFPERTGLTREQDQRIDTYLSGRYTNFETQAKLQGRAEARSNLKIAKGKQFTSAAELADAFDISSLYPNKGEEITPEELIKRREVSATYRRQLMRTIKDMKARGVEFSAKDIKDLQKVTVAVPTALQPQRKK